MQSRKFYPTGPACCVAVGPGGAIYAGTERGLLVFRDGDFAPVPGTPNEAVRAVAANGGAVAFVAGGRVHLREGTGDWTVLKIDASAGSALALDARKPVIRRARALAVSGAGIESAGSEDGLFEGGQKVYPHHGLRSWAPRDVRAVAFDEKGWLYFASPQGFGVRAGSEWRLYTVEDGLPYDDFTAIAPAGDGSIWLGTRVGAIHFDRGNWEYRQGRRWLPGDEVRSIAVKAGDAWFATDAGVGVVETRVTTLAAKARFFEEEIDKRHRRTEYGYVLGVRVRAPGDSREWTQSDSDNDGLWTSMYGAGECFACATGDREACRRATAAFDALRFLRLVTQGGNHPAPPGFVARAILPGTGPDPNLHDSPERDERQRRSDPLWKVMRPRWPLSDGRKWYWKSDTSSDELDGHYFFYARYYDLAARSEEEKRRVREQVAAITDHLIGHGFRLVDHDGRVTRWGAFDPENLNQSPDWWGDRSLNSTSILSYLKVAEHVTGDSKYSRAYQELIGRHGYAQNAMIPKDNAGPGAGNQSDDEMAFMCYYNLLKYETDPRLRKMYGYALRRRWEIERPELCPLFNFIAAASLDLAGGWREESISTLRRYPLDRFNWGLKNSHRRDVIPLAEYANDEARHPKRGLRKNGLVLPVDERFVDHWNHDPWQLDYVGDGRYLADGASFLLPYYMGLYQGFGVD